MIAHFGTTADGLDIDAVTLRAGDLTATILTWGAVVQDVRLSGVDYPLTLGSDHLADYEGEMRYSGSVIGPIVNRISTGRVAIDGMMYELERNAPNGIHLHSGSRATHLRPWKIAEATPDRVTLTLHLPDGDCGLPGDRHIRVVYTLIAPATLTMEITGKTDQPTLMNFANHAMWNLDNTPTWAGHTLRVAADRYLPATPDFTPTGEIADITGSPLDLRAGRVVTPGNPDMDHNVCLSDAPTALRDVLWLTGQSGVTLTLATDQPGMQLFDGRWAIRLGKGTYEGLVFEAQNWPDAPTHDGFPSIRVTEDAPYRQFTTFSFTRS
ncbi:aldose 1-epimerase [Loktanella fryxellensis]|uniref:Aldose 1-epimerase n=1 Tax=Loktanella fryxellensis TaxID=245187 RepID=A0A1H8ATX6_9RHOB|nr:aldose epimerase family protein [Loktanella fryxellensis]SEM74251.1 aldose 1-epimerase [Loktanella fryxellensis]